MGTGAIRLTNLYKQNVNCLQSGRSRTADLASKVVEGKKMAGFKMVLDPGRTGADAQALEENLRKRVIGQEEAIQIGRAHV